MTNMLFQPVDFKIDETPRGVWRRHLDAGGRLFEEFTSYRTIFGMPLIHYTHGRNPETGKLKVAKGFIAIGRIAVGVFPVGQMVIGICPIGQLSIGLLLGIGQLSTGVFAIGQLALGAAFGIGQFATGFLAIGQFAVGGYAIGQRGFGSHVLDTVHHDPAVREFLNKLLRHSPFSPR